MTFGHTKITVLTSQSHKKISVDPRPH